MATVTKKFRDDFEAWAANRIACGEFSEAEMANFKDMLRRDLTPGPDQIREGLTTIAASGIEIPAVIDNCDERYQLWASYFASKASAIRQEASHGA
jgi:hypothetical protein